MPEKLRVAAYCRVSTDKEEQRSSLEAQRAFFGAYIGERGWELVEVLADEGLSGTSIAHRPQFSRMLSMAFRGELDLIVTKEVSRFARNTVDALNVTRRLREQGVGVLFLNDGIDTRDSDGEFRLTIMASVAQEESRKISQRTRWGQTQAMGRGVVFGNNSIYGYTLRRGELTVQPEQAAIVRLIYRKFLTEGSGTWVIARELTEQGVDPPLRPGGAWSSSAVLRILKNEKYCGDLLQQKYRTLDHLSHRKVRNDGTVPQLLLKGHHEGIVSPETFRRVQEELGRRRALAERGKRHSARYWYSGKVLCGQCGGTMAPKRTRRAGGREYLCFVCRNRAGSAERRCTMRGISGSLVASCVRQVLRELGLDRAGLAERLLSPPEELTGGGGERALRKQESRRGRALEAYLDGSISREAWSALNGDREAGSEGASAEERQRLREGILENPASEEWIFSEAVERITVEEEYLRIALCGLPAPFSVRARGRGGGRRSREAKTGAVPSSPEEEGERADI